MTSSLHHAGLSKALANTLYASRTLDNLTSAATAATNLGLGTGNSPQFAGINLGDASDTTLTRTGPGELAVEGNKVCLLAVAQTLTNKDLADSTNSYRAASDTVTGAIEIAVQSEMETASDTVRAVVPGRVQYHPGVAKGWIDFTPSATTPTNKASHNVTSVTRISTGQYEVTWATDFSSANYSVALGYDIDQGTTWTLYVCVNASKAAGTMRVVTAAVTGGANTDGGDMNSVVAFGDQ